MLEAVQRRTKRGEPAEFVFEGYLPFLINRLSIALLAHSTSTMALHGLTIPKYRILMVLRENPICNFKQLAEMTRIEPPTLSRLLNLLEEEKLVRRNRSESDTRLVFVSLSPKGRSAAEKMIPFSNSIEDMLLQGVDEEEASTVRRVLSQMYSNVLESSRPGH